MMWVPPAMCTYFFPVLGQDSALSEVNTLQGIQTEEERFFKINMG